jgi:hypothetical protein
MRRIVIIAACLIAFLAAGWTAYWFVMADRAAGWIAAWAAPAPGKVWHGSFGASEVSGFPFSMDVRLSDPEVTWQGRSGGAVWQGEWLIASFRPWSVSAFDIALPPQQFVSLVEGGNLRMAALSMSAGKGHVAIADNRAQAVRAEFSDLVIDFAQNRPPVAADRLLVEVETVPGEAAWDIALQADNASFQAQAPEPFQGVVPLFIASLRLNGDIPEGPLEQRLAAWRDAGGVVDVHALKLVWPPLDIEGDGSVSLDRQMRPLGAFTADIVGYREAVEAFAAMGRLTQNQANLALAGMDAMARTGEDGVKRLSVPLSMQDGHLYIGPLMLGDLPPILPEGASF